MRFYMVFCTKSLTCNVRFTAAAHLNLSQLHFKHSTACGQWLSDSTGINTSK